MAVDRIARRADAKGHLLVGDGGDGAVEHLGQAVIRMELVPHCARRRAPRETMNDNQLLADEESALQHLGLDALQLGITFEQRL